MSYMDVTVAGDILLTEQLSKLALTHLNDAVLSQVAMSPLESFWFTGAHGDKVEGFLVKPPNFDPNKKYPVKFLIHGGPQGAWGDDWSYRWNPELFAANGYVVIMINFHGSTGYGQKFIDAINGDWGGAPFEDLMKGLDYAEKTYPFIDKDRECALGASYGGYMANWMLGHTDRFKCIVVARRHVQHRVGLGHDRRALVQRVGVQGHALHESRRCTKVVSAQYAAEFQDADAGHPRPARLPARRVSEGFQLFTTLQTAGRAVEDALLPRRRPLGAEAAEFAALVQDGQRLGGPVDEEVGPVSVWRGARVARASLARVGHWKRYSWRVSGKVTGGAERFRRCCSGNCQAAPSWTAESLP